MENNHKLALYVSYYLSRFDKIAYEHLGFGKQQPTHKRIGEILGVNPHTVQNWRDQFDPIHGNRKGWHQREMTQSRLSVVRALADLNEAEVRSIVDEILSGKIDDEPALKNQLTSIVANEPNEKVDKKFVIRTPTGDVAELFFIQYHKETLKPVQGNLVDCRHLGCGFDFRIDSINFQTFVEVKGLADFSGGVLFTDKEWQVATEKGEDFFLCIVKNVNENPEINFIQNPASKIKPKKNIYTTIQINWSVTENDLNILNA